jgi:hypothetical protein
MCNAKKELLDCVNNKIIYWAVIKYRPTFESNDDKYITLNCGYSKLDYETFLKELDFEYDDGYGTQHLFGYVAFNDNTWLSRYEYDGQESWTYNIKPTFVDAIKEYGDNNE